MSYLQIGRNLGLFFLASRWYIVAIVILIKKKEPLETTLLSVCILFPQNTTTTRFLCSMGSAVMQHVLERKKMKTSLNQDQLQLIIKNLKFLDLDSNDLRIFLSLIEVRYDENQLCHLLKLSAQEVAESLNKLVSLNLVEPIAKEESKLSSFKVKSYYDWKIKFGADSTHIPFQSDIFNHNLSDDAFFTLLSLNESFVANDCDGRATLRKCGFGQRIEDLDSGINELHKKGLIEIKKDFNGNEVFKVLIKY